MADNTTDTNHDGKVDAGEAHSAAERARAALHAKADASKQTAASADKSTASASAPASLSAAATSSATPASQPTQPQDGDVNADGATYQNGKWIYLGSSGLVDADNVNAPLTTNAKTLDNSVPLTTQLDNAGPDLVTAPTTTNPTVNGGEINPAGATPLGSTDTAPATTKDQSAGKTDVTDQPNVDANTGREVDFNPPVAPPQPLAVSPPSNEVIRYTVPTEEVARVNPPDLSISEENKPQDIKDHEAAHPLPEKFQVRRTNVVTGEHKRVEMTKEEFNDLKPESENGQEIRYELVQF